MEAIVHHYKNIILEYTDRIEVIMNNDHVAIFDLDDFDLIKQHYWAGHHNQRGCDNPSICKLHQYPVAIIAGKYVKAHNLIMNFKPHDGLSIDHINVILWITGKKI